MKIKNDVRTITKMFEGNPHKTSVKKELKRQ